MDVTEGPQLEALTHRLSECPEEFLFPSIDVTAVVCDHLRDMKVERPERFVAPTIVMLQKTNDENEIRLISVATWLLHDAWFLARPDLAEGVQDLLLSGLRRLADVIDAKLFISDPDRREELVRVCLQHLGLRPAGETPAQAQDRLSSLDSIERVRVMRDTRRAEERAQKVREMMAKRAAEEAAAKVSRE